MLLLKSWIGFRPRRDWISSFTDRDDGYLMVEIVGACYAVGYGHFLARYCVAPSNINTDLAIIFELPGLVWHARLANIFIFSKYHPLSPQRRNKPTIHQKRQNPHNNRLTLDSAVNNHISITAVDSSNTSLNISIK